MDYWQQSNNDKSLWSSCSIEDMTALFSKYPDCMVPATSTNIPQFTPPGLTPLECKMPPFLSDIKGVQKVKLNGKGKTHLNSLIYPQSKCFYKCHSLVLGYTTTLVCINGVCSAKGSQGITNACKYICGKTSCDDAADPGVCDLKKQLNGWTGSGSICVNSEETLFSISIFSTLCQHL